MKLHCLLISYLLIVTGGMATGQEASPSGKEAVPEPPLITGAPPSTQWTINYVLKTPEKEPATPEEIHSRKMRVRYSPQTLSKRVLKSADGQLVVYTNYEADLKSEAWAVNNYIYELPYREGEGMRVTPRGAGDFPEVYWISPANFRGTVEYKGNKVHLYETDEGDTLVDPAAPSRARQKPPTEPVKPVHKRAYIDAKSRLPLFADMGDVVLAYQYSGLTTAFPTPDDRIKKIMREGATPKKR